MLVGWSCEIWFQGKNGGYTVGDFMTGKQHLHVVKPTTSVDDGKYSKDEKKRYLYVSNSIICFFFSLSLFEMLTALELLVEKKVTGLPVIDDDWNLVYSLFSLLLLCCVWSSWLAHSICIRFYLLCSNFPCRLALFLITTCLHLTPFLVTYPTFCLIFSWVSLCNESPKYMVLNILNQLVRR